MRTFVTILVSCLLSAVIAVVACNLYLDKREHETSSSGQQSKDNVKAGHRNGPGLNGSLNFTAAAAAATPAVVHIKNVQKARTRSYSGTPFEDLLRKFYGENFQMPEQELPPTQAFGSGVILTADGYIVTNNHVIQDASQIEVILNDKRSYPAKVVGTDPATDLALIKIEEKDLPYIKFGRSEDLEVGSWVVAVGNPFNLNSTVTSGIVSAKGRSIHILRDENNLGIESFIQTDAVVNPGNSGGALVDLNGELVGINTAIASPTGAFAGYAFAVPETIVKKVTNDLSKYGVVQRALLGVTIIDINAAIAKEKHIRNISGVYVTSVGKGSAAEKAGLQAGDIITRLNGKDINSAARLQEMMATYSPGEKVGITYSRDNKLKDTQAVLHNRNGGTGLLPKQ